MNTGESERIFSYFVDNKHNKVLNIQCVNKIFCEAGN